MSLQQINQVNWATIKYAQKNWRDILRYFTDLAISCDLDLAVLDAKYGVYSLFQETDYVRYRCGLFDKEMCYSIATLPASIKKIHCKYDSFLFDPLNAHHRVLMHKYEKMKHISKKDTEKFEQSFGLLGSSDVQEYLKLFGFSGYICYLDYTWICITNPECVISVEEIPLE